MAKEEKKSSACAENTISGIIGCTLSRHAKLTEEEYKKIIGFENCEDSEEVIVLKSLYNLMHAKTREVLRLKDNFARLHAMLELLKSTSEDSEVEVNGN